MAEERGEKKEKGRVKVAAEVGEDRAERIKRDEKARGAEVPRGAGRVPAEVRKGEA